MDRQIAPAPSQSPGRHQHSNMDRCRTCPYIVPEFVGGPQTHILALRLEVVEDGLHLAARVELQTKDTPAGGQVPNACPRRSTRYAGACSWWVGSAVLVEIAEALDGRVSMKGDFAGQL